MIIILILILISNFGCSVCCCTGGMTGYVEYGNASYYGEKFHGKTTASGEVFNMWDLTCAHKKLPFGTKVRVTNMENNKCVIVRVNDRGPFIKGRIIDLSYAAAKKIALIKYGVVKVKIEVIE